MNQNVSLACENNKRPILKILEQYLVNNAHVLEIGSGTGQHARYFADKFPNILWHTSDLEKNHLGILSWVVGCNHKNISSPRNLDVSNRLAWPKISFDAIFTANTMHIMSWQEVCLMFELAARCLKDKGFFFSYGPFNCDGKFTSVSNKIFNDSLRQQDPKMGIRD